VVTLNRLQEALRESAQAHHQEVSIPGFRIYFDPLRTGRYFSYAIPDPGRQGPIEASVERMAAEFESRSRSLRIEFIEEAHSPDLPERLQAAGLRETERLPVMVCTPGSLRQLPSIPGLEITRLTPTSSVDEALQFRNTQHFGFDPRAGLPVALEDAIDTLRRADVDGMYLARLDGQPAAAGMFQHPVSGLSEVNGIATLEPFRKRGIAAVLSATVTQGAFEAGAGAVFLTAANLHAQNLYLRVGYSVWGTALVYEWGK
jgi:GNAT superfamily N-acetyltransferase